MRKEPSELEYAPATSAESALLRTVIEARATGALSAVSTIEPRTSPFPLGGGPEDLAWGGFCAWTEPAAARRRPKRADRVRFIGTSSLRKKWRREYRAERPKITLQSGPTVLTPVGFKSIVTGELETGVRPGLAGSSMTATGRVALRARPLPPAALFHTFAERVGSSEPYGIDEAHDLSGGCGRF